MVEVATQYTSTRPQQNRMIRRTAGPEKTKLVAVDLWSLSLRYQL